VKSHLRNVWIICAKELKSYLNTPMAYVVTAIFLALSGAFFALYLAGTNYTDTSIKGFLSVAQYLMLLFSAVLTMRLVAEERKLGTWELLLTVPVRDVEIILGKFAGALALLAGMLALTLFFPILLFIFGDPDLGPIITSYVGLLLLGGASLAVGVFASSLTSSQLVSAVVAGGLLFALWFLGLAGSFAPGPLGEVISYLSLSTHFPDFIRGVVDTRAVVYYVSVSAVFLFLAVRSTAADRWR
jgi:gliding motility-associated transport system permease protein